MRLDVLKRALISEFGITEQNVADKAKLYGINLENYKTMTEKMVAVQNAMIDKQIQQLQDQLCHWLPDSVQADISKKIDALREQKIEIDFSGIEYDPEAFDYGDGR